MAVSRSPGGTDNGPPGLRGGRVKSVYLSSAPGREGRMLLHSMWMKAVDPENRIIDTIAHAISPVVVGNLHDSAMTESAQSGIVKGGGTGDVRDSNASVVDHCDSPKLDG